MYKAILTTSANPFHYGHLNLYNTAESIFGKNNVCIVIAKNMDKDTDIEKIRFHITPYNVNYTVIYDDLVADFCKNNGVKFIVRGIRNAVDTEYELKMDFINKKINNELQTIFIPTTDEYSNISSSSIRELIAYGKNDIVKEYMNKESFIRYKNFTASENKFIVVCGKSCVGKTTYINNNFSHDYVIINVDDYIWKTYKKVYGSSMCNLSKSQINSFFLLNKKTEFYDLLTARLTPAFWKAFFDPFFEFKNAAYIFDWAAFGCYFDLIPECYRSKLTIYKTMVDDIVRANNIKSKGFSDKITQLDNFYIDVPFYDKLIDLTSAHLI